MNGFTSLTCDFNCYHFSIIISTTFIYMCSSQVLLRVEVENINDNPPMFVMNGSVIGLITINVSEEVQPGFEAYEMTVSSFT